MVSLHRSNALILSLVVVGLLALAGVASAEGKHAGAATASAAHGKHAPKSAGVPTPSPTPQPTVRPQVTSASPPAAAPRVPSPPAKDDKLAIQSAQKPVYVLHGGVVDLATVSVVPAPTGSRAPVWTWAVPVVGLVGAGAVVATTRALERPRVRPTAHRPAPIASAPQRSALRVAKADVPSLLAAGRDAIAQQRIDEALAWFTQATLLEPTLHVAHYCKGVCLSTLGRYHEAFAALARAHELEPAEAAYRLDLARAGARVGKHVEAMRALGPVLEALPELAEDVAHDEAFAGLADHPRFLAMTGRL